jgi:hypothetical protein
MGCFPDSWILKPIILMLSSLQILRMLVPSELRAIHSKIVEQILPSPLATLRYTY